MRKTIALAFLSLAGGCRKADSYDRRSDTSGVVPPVRASVPEKTIAQTDSGPIVSLTCGVADNTMITDDGIGDLRPGRPVSEVRRLCDVISDAPQRGTEGQTERVLLIKIGGEMIAATIVDDKVWRLDLRTPHFMTADSLGIDVPLHRIAKLRGAQFAPGEDGVYGFAAAHCGMSFRFSLPLRPPRGGQWTTKAIDKDHGDAVVDRVLVRKCG
ncbi:MAG: hypothetical protein ABIZ36_14690 [Gemmatimonadaceae bacterium]